MPHALVLGGTGLVGAAAVERLVNEGWRVTGTGRTDGPRAARLRRTGARFVVSDRHDTDDVRTVLGAGADVVVDCIGYTASDSRLLTDYSDAIGSIVFVSSKAVYVDDAGRHSNSPVAPRFAAPVREDQSTLAPSDVPYASAEGYGPNKVAAERTLLDAAIPASVLRPSRIHGAGAARPREWVFVRRVLDGRHSLLLADGGCGANHPTAAVNLAALIAFCANTPGNRVLNCADPDAPDGRAIAGAIGTHLGHRWDEVLLDASAPDGLGDHPWNTRPPFLLDTSAADELGFRPAGTYAETVGAELDWLVAAHRAGDPNGFLPSPDDPYFARFFDYAAEDEWLRSRS